MIEKSAIQKGTFYVVIDGVPRTIVYHLNFQATAEAEVVVESAQPEIRLVEAGLTVPPRNGVFISTPKDKYSLRVEIDPPADGGWEGRRDRSPTGKYTTPDEGESR